MSLSFKKSKLYFFLFYQPSSEDIFWNASKLELMRFFLTVCKFVWLLKLCVSVMWVGGSGMSRHPSASWGCVARHERRMESVFSHRGQKIEKRMRKKSFSINCCPANSRTKQRPKIIQWDNGATNLNICRSIFEFKLADKI